MRALYWYEKLAIRALTQTSPRRLAKVLLRPYPSPYSSPPLPENARPVSFPSADGGRCRGWLVSPPEPRSDALVILAHGWTSSLASMTGWLDPLLAAGLPVLLYNARGHGDSDPIQVCSLRQFAEDVTGAVNFGLTEARRVVILGHSLGAAATILALAEGAPAQAGLAFAAPAHPHLVTAHLLNAQGLNAEQILARTTPHVEEFIGRTFESMAPELRISEVGRPLLIVHGTADPVVPYENFLRLSRALPPNAAALTVEGADHHSVLRDEAARSHALAFIRASLALPA